MSEPNFFWRENLKFLRNRVQLSQDQLASALKISRVKLNAHENNFSKNPSIGDLAAYADYFGFTIDTFLRVDLSRLPAHKLRELIAGNDIYLSGSQIRILATTVDHKNNEQVEMVPIKAKAGYLSGYSDPEFISKLPKFNIPNLPSGKTYRLFPIKGDSMLPITDGSIIIGAYVQDWLSVKKDTPCIIVIKGQDIAFKLLDTSATKATRKVLLSSLNPRFKPYEADAEDVLEIWQYAGHISNTIPESPGISDIAVAISDIYTELREMRRQDSKA